MKKLILLAATFLLAVGVRAAEFPTITVSDLKTAIQTKKVVLLDANGTESWQSGHIPGAIDYTATKNLASVLPKDKHTLIVAYCKNPQCHAYAAAAAAAKKLGYTNIQHLAAGIEGWKDAGQKTEAGLQRLKT